MSLSREFSEMVQEQNAKFRFIHPLMSGMEFLPFEKHNSRWKQELAVLQEMASRHHWKNMPELLEPLHNPEVAVIVTDVRERIQWVSEGFTRMTGYQQDEALERKPNFLQGKDTDRKTVARVRQALDKQEATETVLLNYRKSGEPYFCQVNIVPLFNQQNKLVNFISVEKEVSDL